MLDRFRPQFLGSIPISGTPVQIRKARPIGHKTSSLYKLPDFVQRWQVTLCCKVYDPRSVCKTNRTSHGDERAGAAARCGSKRTLEIRVRASQRQELKLYSQGSACDLHCSQVGCLAQNIRCPENGHPREPRNDFLKEFQSLPK